mmetsp:Transcript_87519/g.272234  ORF Transcript_87519/g.272234 Transcript_87519/m.272234 type:complete len:377 (+) Transcript_87519:554-1684(+)
MLRCSASASFFFFFLASATPSSTASPSAAAASLASAFFFFFFRSFRTSLIASCMTSMFLRGVVPSVRKANRSSTWSRSFSPKIAEASSEKQSMREAREHLLARYREMRPLFFCCARPMKDEWKMRPYLGVLPLVLRARKSAFSAPRICTVEAGYLARFVRLPACEMSRAPMISPMSVERFGATRSILALRYSCKVFRMVASLMTSPAKWSMFCMSISTMSWPMDIFMAFRTSAATSSAPQASSSSAVLSCLKLSRTRMTRETFAYAMLSVTIFASSGKCHAYHSRTRMAKVLMFLSRLSSSAMVLMMGLSWRFGSSCMRLRLKACPRPSRALVRSNSLRSFTSLLKCRRTPLSSSRTVCPCVTLNCVPSSLPSSGS